jgi:hypothetical protein
VISIENRVTLRAALIGTQRRTVVAPSFAGLHIARGFAGETTRLVDGTGRGSAAQSTRSHH